MSDPYRKEPGRVFGMFPNCMLGEKSEMGDESRIKLGSVLVMIISFKILFLCIKDKLNIGVLCIQIRLTEFSTKNLKRELTGE